MIHATARAMRRASVLALAALSLAACSADGLDPRRPKIDTGSQTASVVAPGHLRPSFTQPGFPQPGFTAPEPAVMPDSEIACRKRLKRMGVTFTDGEPIDEGNGCAVPWPVKVSGLPRGVALTPTATLTCAMAEAVAKWTKEELVPSTRRRYLSGVDTIRQGSSYSCRMIRGAGKLSAHGTGEALDIMDITLKSGRTVDVRKPGFFSFREKSLLNNVRADACPYFSTVLGPGFYSDHKDHFHFDLMERSNGYKVCR